MKRLSRDDHDVFSNKHFIVLFFAVTMELFSCKTVPNQSKNSGFFEGMTADEADRIAQQNQPAVLAEYQPTEAVFINSSLFTLYPDTAAQMVSALLSTGVKLRVIATPEFDVTKDAAGFPLASDNRIEWVRLPLGEGKTLPSWSRDFMPMLARTKGGKPLLLDFNYQGQFDNRVPERLPTEVADAFRMSRLSLPMNFEPGNFMINSQGICVTMQRVIELNKSNRKVQAIVDSSGRVVGIRSPGKDSGLYRDMRTGRNDRPLEAFQKEGFHSAEGWLVPNPDLNDPLMSVLREDMVVLNESQIVTYFKRYLGCQKTILLPTPISKQGDLLVGTTHIDMFTKFIDDRTVLLQEIDESSLESLTNPGMKDLNLQLKDYLDQVRKILQQHGFDVKRIIAPPLVNHLTQKDITSPDGPFIGNILNRGYANSLIVNHAGIRYVLVPSYTKMGGYFNYTTKPNSQPLSASSDAEKIARYEKQVKNTYEKLGFRVMFIDSAEPIANGGAVHCLTMQWNR